MKTKLFPERQADVWFILNEAWKIEQLQIVVLYIPKSRLVLFSPCDKFIWFVTPLEGLPSLSKPSFNPWFIGLTTKPAGSVVKSNCTLYLPASKSENKYLPLLSVTVLSITTPTESNK